ncbi:UDP-N-acetylmuramoyl-tripeptide--D-alanyl-D-alanine ligase [Brachybacterium endophyticum]|uniref:UDP-N-acetylmuramoyl-tripeptide--D-alanyl-D-alanine ligase n=1 Tax=Brachybacterium endophyticum TaxID=2182385 RepID=A0A2U2RLN7_9MICO|nr:UDP-N-acetylmuramoyl-tripeptide--D-alanyl-D-alanine ligase [Brachybacterium endophyticum]PWH06788.1 UDP-N-acetylmuramoyl-tripeptide--D-alanyl-D-alanine ligase [Brachybacterium endophyticum]
MLAITAQEIAELTDGELIGGALGSERVSGRARIDSRDIETGDLFAAFHGENTDGHRFVTTARDAGAALALVTDEVDVPAVRVADVEKALSDLARAQLERARSEREDLLVVALTGSAGKTGTKDLLGSLLGELGPTIAPAGSFNNELGLPLTVLSLTTETRFLVLEMGARGIGHIAHLTSIARPDISLVLNVGTAHLGEFGSVDAIARAKGEIIEALLPTGRAVLNADDARVAGMASRTEAPVTTWGQAAGDVRIQDLRLDDDAHARLTLSVPEGLTRLDGSTVPAETREITLALLGEHQALNAVAATTAALLAGMDLADVARVLPTLKPLSGQRMEAVHAAGDVLILNDAYNANPDSMRQALKTLAHLGRTRRTIAVLGEMLELGEDSLRLHDEVGRLAVRLNISHLIAVGPGAMPIHRGACLEGSFGEESEDVPDLDVALARLTEYIEPGDVVLLKSSRDSGLRTLAEPLRDALAGRGDLGDRGDAAGMTDFSRGPDAGEDPTTATSTGGDVRGGTA